MSRYEKIDKMMEELKTEEDAVNLLTYIDGVEFPGDAEAAHEYADSVLTKFLRVQGFIEIADLFEKLRKDFWYA